MKRKHTENRLLEYNHIMKENDNVYREIAKTMGLPESSFWILYMLRTDYTEPVQSEICLCLYEPKQTVNSALKKMETEGYLDLVPGNDRRSKKILLTEKGIRLCERTVDKIIEMELQALEELSEDEQEQFLSLFQKYTDSLKMIYDKNT